MPLRKLSPIECVAHRIEGVRRRVPAGRERCGPPIELGPVAHGSLLTFQNEPEQQDRFASPAVRGRLPASTFIREDRHAD